MRLRFQVNPFKPLYGLKPLRWLALLIVLLPAPAFAGVAAAVCPIDRNLIAAEPKAATVLTDAAPTLRKDGLDRGVLS